MHAGGGTVGLSMGVGVPSCCAVILPLNGGMPMDRNPLPPNHAQRTMVPFFPELAHSDFCYMSKQRFYLKGQETEDEEL